MVTEMKFLIAIHITQFMGSILMGIIVMSLALHTMEEDKTIARLVSYTIQDLTSKTITDI
jgi:hypothetical protein